MKAIAQLPAGECALYWRNYSNRTGIPEFVVEKDFWVCWLLGRILATPQLGSGCVCKGDTSLSKVFHAINRSSEDIDLGLTPASLGWNEADLDDAPSTTQRQKRSQRLQTDCAEVVALEIERSFWEKATILHAEYHRRPPNPCDRFAQHYADFAALWEHPGGPRAAARLDLRARVRLHKSRFFASNWAHYATAVPGSLRLAPPDSRLTELRRDYAAMDPMFLSPPPPFDELLATLRDAEKAINMPAAAL